MDNLTPLQRSRCMTKIRNKNTKTELVFRKYIWTNGIKGYTVKSNLFGKPDIYFPKYRIAVFIDGCFWHKCPSCFIEPKTGKDYWGKKIKSNTARDLEVNKELSKIGVHVLRLWEHEIKRNPGECYKKLIKLIIKK